MFGIFKYCYDVIKRQRIPKGKSQMDNPEKLTTYGTQDEEKQSKNTTQYVLDTTMRKQTQRHELFY
jgi:hypothetical protein